MWCHYCNKNKSNHNTADFRAITKFKQQKKACFEAKDGPRKKSLAFIFLFEEINALKRQLKPEKTASSKNRKAESILSTEINETIQPLIVMKLRIPSTCSLCLNPLVPAKLS
jgi:hypothetical protein